MNFVLFITSLLLQQQLIPIAVNAQRTSLDVIFKELYRPLRLLGLAAFERTSESRRALTSTKEQGRLQKISPSNQRKFCNTKNGRSAKRPTSVHRLRPGDIDIIGGLGDSITAGNGVMASTVLEVTVENRGESWSMGGVGNWRQFLTLPNILKEFNPNLYGYSVRDGLGTERTSRFNVAELGAMSRDMPYMAKVLLQRMQRDPKVNMTADWKLVTLLIGNNDFCADICYWPNPAEAIKAHERNMLQTYRFLRDNIPRLFLNVVLPPDLTFIRRFVDEPAHCKINLPFECPCLRGQHRSEAELKGLRGIIKNWLKKDNELANRDEFNTETFTINVHTFTQFGNFIKRRKGNTDFRYLAPDCFHLSQFGQASAANALWNNMFETTDEKSLLEPILLKVFHCPTERRPYLLTRENINFDYNNTNNGTLENAQA